jgi:hypothetical protein
MGQKGQNGFDASTAAYVRRIASQIARTMARKDVSPKGLGSRPTSVRSRLRELERAKRILQQRRQSAR